MSLYTTGEIAKLCHVSVRTVQYYDSRELLCPSQLSEGGRRLYTEADVKKLETICLLKELGLSLQAIGGLLKEDDPGSVIGLMLEQQAGVLKEEIGQREGQLECLNELRRGLREVEGCSIETIGVLGRHLGGRRKLHRLYAALFAIGLGMEVFELAALLLWVGKGIWWPTALWAVMLVPFIILFSRVYFGRVAYVCPRCHERFRPGMGEALFASHTLRTRRLTCPHCGRKGFCVEVWGEEKGESASEVQKGSQESKKLWK